jgi:sugar/nucleoside kinase (ribokinase family)
MTTNSFDLAVVGHFSIDSLKLPNRSQPYTVLGGAVAYVSLVTRRLGGTVAVISKVGKDFPQAYTQRLLEEGAELSNVVETDDARTTSFGLTYNRNLSARALKLRHHCSEITKADLPSALRAKAIHLAPIAVEIPFQVVEHLKNCTNCLSIDPQGMTRRFDEEGNVACCAQMDERILPLVNIYKSSVDEIAVLTGQSDLNKAIQTVHHLGPEIVIATMSAKGSLLSVKGEIFPVPACKSTRVVDPTGAGDVFIGGFLAEYVRQKDPLWCACVGSAAASLVVEDVGTTFFGEKAEIYRRASVIYEKEIKQ